MDDDLKQKCIDYINANAASLHGVEPAKLDIGPDVTVDNIVDASIRGDEAMVIVDRGVKGTPKYTIALSLLKEAKQEPAYTALNPQYPVPQPPPVPTPDPRAPQPWQQPEQAKADVAAPGVEAEAAKVDKLQDKYQGKRK